MGTIQINSRVGEDGILHLAIPVGAADANAAVIVTIEPAGNHDATQKLDWHHFVNQTYGSCAGLGLVEPDDPPPQDREWPR